MGLANVVSFCPLVSLGHTNGFGLVHPEPAKALAVASAAAGTSRAALLLPAVSLPYDREHTTIADSLVHRSHRSGG